MLYKISVIIPVYNSEKYLNQCIESLMQQTLNEIEYIFINDASTDNSLSIIKKHAVNYPKRCIKIFDLQQNGGISNARNIGLKYATGEYITHCDSDDWIDKDAYKFLYDLAQKNNADIVTYNYIHEYTNKQIVIEQPYSSNKDEIIIRMLNGSIFPALWSNIIKREIIYKHDLHFPNGLNMGEDLYFNIRAYYYSKVIISTDIPFYHYRHTENSTCVRRSRQAIESDIAIAGLIEVFLQKDKKFQKAILYRKFFSKLALIIHFDNCDTYRKWMTIYPETHADILSYNQIDKKLRFLLWLSAHHLYKIAVLIRQILNIQNNIKKQIKRHYQFAK